MKIITMLALVFISALLISCGGGSDGSSNDSSIENSSEDDSSSSSSGGSSGGSSGVDENCFWDSEEQEMLDLINEARSQARYCGSTYYEATTSLEWNCTLEIAAQSHSDDMAENNFFDHISHTDESSVGDRVTSAGYTWYLVGENIAAGQPSSETVMQDWLDSPGHCQNIMNPNYEDVAVAYRVIAGARYSIYWTQVFASTF